MGNPDYSDYSRSALQKKFGILNVGGAMGVKIVPAKIFPALWDGPTTGNHLPPTAYGKMALAGMPNAHV